MVITLIQLFVERLYRIFSIFGILIENRLFRIYSDKDKLSELRYLIQLL